MTHNRRRAAMLLSGVGVVVGVVVLVVTWLVGLPLLVALLLGVVVGAAAGFGVSASSVAIVERLVGAEPVDPDDHPRLFNVLEGLCLAAGVRQPAVRVVDDQTPNALAMGRNRRHATIVVTRGLLDSLDRMELEGLLAHLLVRIKEDDARLDTVAAVVVGIPLTPFGGLRVSAMRTVLGPERALRADLASVTITRYPPGLLHALVVLHEAPGALRSGATATAHMWVAEPVGAGAAGQVHLPIADRIEVLQEL